MSSTNNNNNNFPGGNTDISAALTPSTNHNTEGIHIHIKSTPVNPPTQAIGLPLTLSTSSLNSSGVQEDNWSTNLASNFNLDNFNNRTHSGFQITQVHQWQRVVYTDAARARIPQHLLGFTFTPRRNAPGSTPVRSRSLGRGQESPAYPNPPPLPRRDTCGSKLAPIPTEVSQFNADHDVNDDADGWQLV